MATEHQSVKGPVREFASQAQAAWYGSAYRPTLPRQITTPAEQLPDGTIPGRDLVVGDVIDFLGRHHQVDRFEPYKGSLKGVLGEGTRVARSDDGWGMTI